MHTPYVRGDRAGRLRARRFLFGEGLTAEELLSAMRDDVHDEVLALIDDIAEGRDRGVGRMTDVDAVLRGRMWVVCVALGGLLVVLDAGRC